MARKYSEIKAIDHEKNLGKTAALYTGLKNSLGSTVVLFETDWQYDPKDIYKLVKALKKHNVDIVNGKRKIRADVSHRKVMSKLYNVINHMFAGTVITDRNSGIKAFKKKVLHHLYELDVEVFDHHPIDFPHLVHRDGGNRGTIDGGKRPGHVGKLVPRRRRLARLEAWLVDPSSWPKITHSCACKVGGIAQDRRWDHLRFPGKRQILNSSMTDL